MPLKMKSKERSKFVLWARAEYARLSAKKEKGAMIHAVIQLAGYKSGKNCTEPFPSYSPPFQLQRLTASSPLKARHEALNPWGLREKIQAAAKEILRLQE